MVFPLYAHGKDERTTEDGGEDPGPRWEDVVGNGGGYAGDGVHSERRRKDDEEKLEEERYARGEQHFAGHGEGCMLALEGETGEAAAASSSSGIIFVS